MTHRSRLTHIVLDVDDLDAAAAFWAPALRATEESIQPASRAVYRRFELPGEDVRLLLHRVADPTAGKPRAHLDIETDDVEAEVARLESLGARRARFEAERTSGFWVLDTPCGHALCVLPPEQPDLLARATPPG
ncbi:VOC family protein [Egibacter rhizosphaerae]|uniref:VOC family protein n=1 Tax=Egibacter rhizosphaerae TaxID=1670831 RepID=A0A411YCZ8_9ACTN|nr:VOC family protein [Egibacter rhizosphaerae]QBI19079.1 VOC family protein [Egibacter rhizosphaerae]